MMAADSALVERLRRGERAAFRDLYARFAQASFGYLVRLAGRRDAAEDLHQEVWLSIARHAGGVTADTDLAAWVFTVARNRFISSRRRPDVAMAVAAVDASDPAVAGPPPADDPGCRDLERALASLPDVHREVLLLVGVEGLRPIDAAVVCGITPEALRQRLKRARDLLSVRLESKEVRR